METQTDGIPPVSAAHAEEGAIAALNIEDTWGEDEHDCFVDYTAATTWEALCAEIEAKLRVWKGGQAGAGTPHPDGGHVFVTTLKTKLPHFRPEKYRLVLHRPPERNDVREWFRLPPGEPYALLFPNSFSGCVLDEDEARALASALAVACMSAEFPHPLLIPLLDRQRRSYRGVRRNRGGRISTLETDCIRSATLAANVLDVPAAMDHFLDMVSCSEDAEAVAWVKDHCTLTALQVYQLAWPSANDSYDEESTSLSRASSGITLWIDDWNLGCPWYPLAEYSDPVVGVWVRLHWQAAKPEHVHADIHRTGDIDGARSRGVGGGRGVPHLQSMAHVSRAEIEVELKAQSTDASSWLSAMSERKDPESYSFSQMVLAFQGNLSAARLARTAGELTLGAFWDGVGPMPEPPSKRLLDSQVESIFKRRGGRGAALYPQYEEGGIGGQPLLGALSLYSLAYGDNARAVAMLWKQFVHDIRLCYWEEGRELPGMGACVSVDLTAPLLEQKLQLLAVCIKVSRGEMGEAGGENPELLTSDLADEFDQMFSLARGGGGRKDVWLKAHGRSIRRMASAFKAAHSSRKRQNFRSFCAHVTSSAYFGNFSRAGGALRDDGFNRTMWRECWEACGKDVTGGGNSDACAVALRKGEMALDWLENVPPPLLFGTLYTHGAASALAVLRQSRAHELAPVRALSRDVAGKVERWAPLALTFSPEHSESFGDETDQVCFHLHHLEMCFAFAESLLQKLPFVPRDVLSGMLHDFTSDAHGRKVGSSATMLRRKAKICRPGQEPDPGGAAASNALSARLFKQQLSFEFAGECCGPWFSALVFQDVDAGMTRFATTATM